MSTAPLDANYSVAQVAVDWISFDNRMCRNLDRTPRAFSKIFALHVSRASAMVRAVQDLAILYPKENS